MLTRTGPRLAGKRERQGRPRVLQHNPAGRAAAGRFVPKRHNPKPDPDAAGLYYERFKYAVHALISRQPADPQELGFLPLPCSMYGVGFGPASPPRARRVTNGQPAGRTGGGDGNDNEGMKNHAP